MHTRLLRIRVSTQREISHSIPSASSILPLFQRPNNPSWVNPKPVSLSYTTPCQDARTDNFTQNWVFPHCIRPRTMTSSRWSCMQSNFSNRYNFLMPLSVSVFNQRQISSIKNYSTLLTSSLLYNISCRLCSQHLTQLQLQTVPGILDSPKPLKTPVPLGMLT